MDKPRIFLGSSGEQAALLDPLVRGLANVALVEPWTTSTFQPGTMTLEALLKEASDVDFALFLFAPDDATDSRSSSQASPRDNVVFEAGLFAGTLGIRRTLILHGRGVKLPSDLLGLTLISYDPKASLEHEMTAACATIRPILLERGLRGSDGPTARIEGLWWQFALGGKGDIDPAVVSFMRIERGQDGVLSLRGSAWAADGSAVARFWSRATAMTNDGLFYYWEGDWPAHKGAPALYGKGEIRPLTKDTASGYYTTRSDVNIEMNERKAVEYFRAQPGDEETLNAHDQGKRELLIEERIKVRNARAFR